MGQTWIIVTTKDGGYQAVCDVIVTMNTTVDNPQAEDTSQVRKVYENGLSISSVLANATRLTDEK